MASSQRPGQHIHQDYIARIRYSNALPPPPNPPKLLDIPNTGLASGQYTAPSFASRLTRDQPYNIEADAELGMPLDLVGMPGIFDGDESSIQAPLVLPLTHPHDRALLKPLSSLGKPRLADAGVSFLRRTEYISSYTSKSRFDSTTSRALINNIGNRKLKPVQSIDKESPEYIKGEVEKSFVTAALKLKGKTEVRHPTKRGLKLLDSYPLLPDHSAFSDVGGYISVKFLTNPVPPSTTYDFRLESSMLLPVQPDENTEEGRAELERRAEIEQRAKDLHELDPINNPAPKTLMDYDFYMPEDAEQARLFKRKLDVNDPDRDEDSSAVRLKRIRAYETAQSIGEHWEQYDHEVVLTLNDGTDGVRPKAAHYYPLVQHTTIRPQRNKNIQRHRAQAEESSGTDTFLVSVEDLDEEGKARRLIHAKFPYGTSEEQLAEFEMAEARKRGEVVDSIEGEGEVDAEGEEDE